MKTKEINKFRKTYAPYAKGCYFKGFKLAVLFDEKEDVKRYGGRWDAGEQTWWMPLDCLSDDVHESVGTVANWLNDHKMIIGQYGEFNETEHNVHLFSDSSSSYTEYFLNPPTDSDRGCPKFKVRFFYDQDVATFIPTGSGKYSGVSTEYLTLEDGRKRWNKLTNAGYNRIENS